MTEKEIINILLQNARLFEIGDPIKDMVRFILKLILNVAATLANAGSAVFNVTFEVMGFGTSSDITQLITSLKPVIIAVLFFSIFWIGVSYITGRRGQGQELLRNCLIFIAVISSSTVIMSAMSQIVEAGKDGLISASANNPVYSVIGQNMTDLIQLDSEVGLANLDPDNYPTLGDLTESEWRSMSYSERVNYKNSKLTSSQAEKILSKKVVRSGKPAGSSDAYTLEDIYNGFGWNTTDSSQFMNEFYYRYSVDYMTVLISLVCLILLYWIMAYKVFRILFELGVSHILLAVLSANINSSEKTKKVFFSIIDGYCVILVACLMLRMYAFGLGMIQGIANTHGGLAGPVTGQVLALFLRIFLVLAVLDGPNLVQRLFGIDVGVGSGLHRLIHAGTAAAALGKGLKDLYDRFKGNGSGGGIGGRNNLSNTNNPAVTPSIGGPTGTQARLAALNGDNDGSYLPPGGPVPALPGPGGDAKGMPGMGGKQPGQNQGRKPIGMDPKSELGKQQGTQTGSRPGQVRGSAAGTAAGISGAAGSAGEGTGEAAAGMPGTAAEIAGAVTGTAAAMAASYEPGGINSQGKAPQGQANASSSQEPSSSNASGGYSDQKAAQSAQAEGKKSVQAADAAIGSGTQEGSVGKPAEKQGASMASESKAAPSASSTGRNASGTVHSGGTASAMAAEAAGTAAGTTAHAGGNEKGTGSRQDSKEDAAKAAFNNEAIKPSRNGDMGGMTAEKMKTGMEFNPSIPSSISSGKDGDMVGSKNSLAGTAAETAAGLASGLAGNGMASAAPSVAVTAGVAAAAGMAGAAAMKATSSVNKDGKPGKGEQKKDAHGEAAKKAFPESESVKPAGGVGEKARSDAAAEGTNGAAGAAAASQTASQSGASAFAGTTAQPESKPQNAAQPKASGMTGTSSQSSVTPGQAASTSGTASQITSQAASTSGAAATMTAAAAGGAIGAATASQAASQSGASAFTGTTAQPESKPQNAVQPKASGMTGTSSQSSVTPGQTAGKRNDRNIKPVISNARPGGIHKRHGIANHEPGCIHERSGSQDDSRSSRRSSRSGSSSKPDSITERRISFCRNGRTA